MVKRTIIGKSDGERLVDLMRGAREQASSGHTVPHGLKYMNPGEDLYWQGGTGSERSVRQVDEELEDARGRISDAEQELIESQQRVDEARAEADAAQQRLDTLDETTLPAVRDELEAVASEAASELGKLDGKLVAAEQELETAKGNLTQLGEDLAAEAGAREQLASDTQGTFSDLDDRLADFGTDPALEGLRGELEAARDKADSAASAASAANDAASAASQAALEAAGIAASKGRVIIQDTEPVGEDRNAANIWIKPVEDDPDTDIEERAVTYVYLEASNEWIPTTSDELAQAAQNALDAREAAQQAQQRAETAISNAATAQSAAEAAQRTADEATTDAREAHNEAVAAAEAARAAIERGDSLIANGSFELDTPAWGRVAGRQGVIEHEGARTGSRVMRLTPVEANAYPMSERFPVQQGRLIHVQMWYRYFPGDRASRLGVYYVQRDGSGTSVGTGMALDQDGNRTYLYADDMPEGEWALFEGVIPVVEGATSLSVGPHALSSSTDLFHIDDLLAVDVTEVRAAQARADEAYAEAASKLDEDEIDAKVAASANGKNSITRSTSPASGDGVVEGDAWYQVDSAGDAFAMWYWDGADWVPSKVRNEMIDTLDVNKVVGGSGDFEDFFAENFTANDGVIEKLWTDQLVGKTAAFNRITVASGNLIPDLATAIESGATDALGYWRNFEIQGSEEFWVDGSDSSTRYIEHEFRVKAGVRYRFTVDARASTPDTMFSIRTLDSSGTAVGFGDWTGHAGGSYPFNGVLVPGSEFTTFESTGVATSDVTIKILVYPNRPGGADNTGGRLLFRNLSVQAMTGAVLIEDGAVGADQIRADEVGAEVGEFVEAEVGNLKATTGTVGEAVIEKLWVDGLVGKSATFNRMTVAPGNLIPDPHGKDPEITDYRLGRSPGWSLLDKAEWRKTGDVTGNNAFRMEAPDRTYETSSLNPGQRYVLSYEVYLDAGSASCRWAIRYTTRDGSTSYVGDGTEPGGDEGTYTDATGGRWTTITRYWDAPSDATTASFDVQINSVHSDASDIRFRNASVRPMVGSTLIEPGAVKTGNIEFTGELSGEVASFMSTESKKLVVSEEAILNRATLIGKTVVDDINVQGKLVGKDGTFTGTVDFANVNVTGELLASEISGEYLYGTVIEGGEIRTDDGLAGQVTLSNTGYRDGGSGGYFPGVRITPTDAHNYSHPPGIGPNSNGLVISGGRRVGSAHRTHSILAPDAAGMYHRESDSGGASAYMQVEQGVVTMRHRGGDDSTSALQARTGRAEIRSTASGSEYTWVRAEPHQVELAAVDSNNSYISQIQANDWSASLGVGTRMISVTKDWATVTARNNTNAGGSVEAGHDGVIIQRLNEDNMAVCGINTMNNEVHMFGSDGQYLRGRVRAGSTGVILESGQGIGLNVFDGGVTVTGDATVQDFTGSILRLQDPPTTSGSGNALIAGGGTNGIFFKVTSSRRYKRNITDWNPDADRVMGLQPRQWQHRDPAQPGNIDETWHVGFVAEEVHDLGLRHLVKYEGDGAGGWRPDGLNYDRFAAAHQVVLQKHEAEINELRERIAQLESNQ